MAVVVWLQLCAPAAPWPPPPGAIPAAEVCCNTQVPAVEHFCSANKMGRQQHEKAYQGMSDVRRQRARLL